jgi:hypothetical protein
MNGTFFDIGLGLGLATACGLRPYLPALLAGALASSSALGVAFRGSRYHFLQSGWWLLAIAAVLAIGYVAQLRLGSERFDGAASGTIAVHALAVGALLFAGTLAGHGEEWWPGLPGGAAAALLSRAAVVPIVKGARSRLPDRAALQALTVYLDAGSLALAGLVALLHPLGYVVPVLVAWLLLRARARGDAKYAGLRIMRR